MVDRSIRPASGPPPAHPGNRSMIPTTRTTPAPAAVLELLKPVTWFPPMWAFGCGVVASGMPLAGRWGIALAGPLVCATS